MTKPKKFDPEREIIRSKGKAQIQARIATMNFPPAEKRRPLNPRQQKFVEIWAQADGRISLTEAALQAGYPKSYAHIAGSNLTKPEKYPNVVAAIQRRVAELNYQYGTTFERHMRDLQYIRDKAMEAGAWSAAVQAEYRRGQALGTIYIDRKEIRHGTIDSMSKEEVMRKLQELKKIYQSPGGITDVEETEVARAIEVEKNIDHSEEFIEAGNAVLSEGEDGDDEGEDHEDRIMGESGNPGLPDRN